MALNDSERSAPGGERPPRIGITSYLEQAQTGVWDVRASFLPQVYLDAVTSVGGIAFVLPPQPVSADTARAIIASLDGIIFSGGADINPAAYGEAAHEKTGAPRDDRDTFEGELVQAAIEAKIPFLGICRGAQILNVELGGTLLQHLPDVVGDDRYQLGAARFNPIEVEVEPGTRIAEVYGNALQATAPLYHHQGLGEIGEGLVVTSRTSDGIVESVELPTVPFGLAVQWHPEEHPEDRRLFEGLVAAAQEYAARKELP
ncbi:gamma-glutamyl-gamma-aminobutyrate hydrolase family protein [Leucobacter salsicius]|uniref:gamma-glutamyl-gamma-aminobutyrate hydrolase family protein n=1 Tax=Leucobacter salsicius TaxID=664638 RepID=UPI00034D4A2A|nr:gamma-glutamyl-gamma-aminobutyrate hydrolase family protein [Leucobacter salsicius]